MSNPYEDLEYLAEFLPEEGESLLVSRRRGQLVCEPYMEPLNVGATQTGTVDREFYGRLAMVDARMKVLWQTPIIVAVLSFYWLSVMLHRVFVLGWSAWYLDLGIALIVAVSCYQVIQFLQRQYFLKSVCPLLQKWMVDHQLDKYTLIAWLTTHRNMSTLRSALMRWT